MKTWFFTETAYPYLPDEYESIRVVLPNRIFNPRVGAELYHRYLDEWLHAEEAGLDIMLNEHHQTATCLDPAAPLMLAILARETSKARLLILGNPIANRRQPVRVAEEMAMVDNLSRGRLECGFVRGVPYEISAMNSSPVRMSERFWEAHDLIMKAWTSHDGPFSWEGRYFHHRQVNIWPRPYQEPHPPVWITSLSPGSIAPIADRRYVVGTFLTGFDGSKAIFNAYRERAHENGWEAPNDRFAYAALVYTGETDEEGFAGARKLMWYIESNHVSPQFINPPGYVPPEVAAKAMRNGGSLYKYDKPNLEGLISQGVVFAGNPDTVFKQIKTMYDYNGGFGHLLVMGQAGFLDNKETVRGIDLLAKEVYPRLKELH
ncbi:MAG TPA: LLM class flavin-dependent oxidoreductase [Candidatus Binataceae bacterium]|nr:LLM class flavin-dependent oxidoreductase [Candidatus Binataceae bacterium]